MNLALFKFTNLADRAINSDAWFVDLGDVVDTLDGNDTIAASGGGNGIEIGGTLNTGAGNDTIKASTTDYTAIKNYRTINTGTGDDTITGIGVRLGNGSFGTGINNQAKCRINTGAGNDTIKGSSIDNSGRINTGAGNDTIKVNSIDNSGAINTGAGNDIVDALVGGFNGTSIGLGGTYSVFAEQGTTNLGANNDTLKGFGGGKFNGGTGIDKILLGEGTYQINGNSIKSDYAKYCNTVYLGDGIYEDECVLKGMNVNEFERIGGVNGGLFAFKDGTLTVDGAGVGTFS